MNKVFLKVVLAVLAVVILWEPLSGYPVDGYAVTGIRRLLRLQLILEGVLKGEKLPAGGLKMLKDIQLNLVGERGNSLQRLPAVDPVLQKQIDALFPDMHQSYSLALLDITPGRPFRYAQRQADRHFVPGSIGKLAVITGLFAQLKRLYPENPEKRRELLKTRMVKGGPWVIPDHHTIPVFDPQARVFARQIPRETHEFSLYEWADHMLSVSANAAASVVWKELVLMQHFGKEYPPAPEQETQFFSKIPKNELALMVMSVVNDPLRELGIAKEDWVLGNLFTAGGKRLAPGLGGSTAAPRGLMQFMVALERGLVMDQWSSLEIKRLMYMTDRRIRYVSAPALADAGVYFKSGSQYKCKPEPGFTCVKYKGNVDNYMNSVVIVEHADGRVYIVVLMSNVLRKNSAVDHQTLAAAIDKLITPQKLLIEGTAGN
jgi:hypothetical protein